MFQTPSHFPNIRRYWDMSSAYGRPVFAKREIAISHRTSDGLRVQRSDLLQVTCRKFATPPMFFLGNRATTFDFAALTPHPGDFDIGVAFLMPLQAPRLL